MRKIGFVILMLLFATLVVSCGGNDVSKRLEQMDALLAEGKVDSVVTLLDEITLNSLQSKEDSAYYILIKTEARYRVYTQTPADSVINYSVEYYKGTSDKEKLARAYYYKGVISYEIDKDLTASVMLLKQAEADAEGTDNLLLKHKIYEKLAYYNGNAFEEALTLKYSKKALTVAKELNDSERQAAALIYMSSAYLHLGKNDSSKVCINECMPLIDSMDDLDKAHVYANIGQIFENDNPQLAKLYLQKAISIRGLAYAYQFLSNIYLREDSIDKAKSLWSQALEKTKGNDVSKVRTGIFKAMRKQSIEQHDFMLANALADSILLQQERLFEKQREEKVAEIQAKYDKETAVRDLREKYMVWGMGLLALTVIVIAFLGYKSRQGIKAKKELVESNIQLEAYTKKAEELESSGKASATEINNLHEKINELTHRHSGILAKGKELYDAIEAGGTTVRWTKDDFINYLEYYKMRDLPFVNEMETGYNRLSPKYIFFAVLEHEGKDDEDVQRIMGISESTLRSTRSRINSKKR
jgi:tetratricopeptide (TPR) repeat protein